MKSLVIRAGIFFGLIVIGSLFSWWATAIMALIAAFFIESFFEIIAIGLYYDLLFHIPGNPWYGQFLHTLIFLVIVIITVIIQKITRKPHF
jgi:hypothetical protein